MKRIIHDFLLIIGLLILAVMIMGYPIMWLWNWLMPVIFGLPIITFWQAIGINLLATLLFKDLSPKNNK